MTFKDFLRARVHAFENYIDRRWTTELEFAVDGARDCEFPSGDTTWTEVREYLQGHGATAEFVYAAQRMWRKYQHTLRGI